MRCSARSSIQRTGRPRRIESHGTTRSSGYWCSLHPNPPPTLGTITRMSDSRSPSIIDSVVRRMYGLCVDAHTVSRPFW